MEKGSVWKSIWSCFHISFWNLEIYFGGVFIAIFFFLTLWNLEIRFGFVSFTGYLWSCMLFPLLYFPSLALMLFSLSFSYFLFPFSQPLLSFLCYTPISLTFSLFFDLLISSLLWFSFYLSSLILFSIFFTSSSYLT